MWNLDTDSTLLHALSLYNPFGIIASLMSPLSVGGRVVLLERFDTMKVWSHLLGIQINGEYVPRTNIYAGVPTHFENLLKRYKEVFTVSTLPAEMFGGSDFWLETRVIIKISKKMKTNLKPKVFFIRKKQK